MKRTRSILLGILLGILAIVLLKPYARSEPRLECSGDSCVFSGYSFLLTMDNDGPFCKVDGSDEYEPCSWRTRAEQAAKEAQEAREREDKEKSACRAKGCLVVRQTVNFVYVTNPPSYPPNWRCECSATVKHTKKEAAK
jgi:hypothetical protein